MNAILRLIIRDFRVVNRSLLVVQFLLPFFLLFVAGLTYKTLIPSLIIGSISVSYQQFLAAGLVAQATMTGSLLSGTLLWTDRRHGMFEQILMGPFRRADYVISKIISSALIGSFGAAVILLVSTTFFLNNIKTSIIGLFFGLVSVFTGAILFGAIAIFIASRVRSLEAFEGIFNLLLILLTFLSSVLYPVSASPQILRFIILANPLTYMSDIIRYGLLGLYYTDLPLEGVVLGVECLLALLLALNSLHKAINSL